MREQLRNEKTVMIFTVVSVRMMISPEKSLQYTMHLSIITVTNLILLKQLKRVNSTFPFMWLLNFVRISNRRHRCFLNITLLVVNQSKSKEKK